jgi:hypothetical protein
MAAMATRKARLKPKKRSNRSWRVQLDALARAVVLERDGHRCVRCGSDQWVQWSHVYTRRILCLRWDPRNSKALCASCHRWWHDNPAESGPWWVDWVGEETADELARIRKQLPQIAFEDVERMLKEGSWTTSTSA